MARSRSNPRNPRVDTDYYAVLGLEPSASDDEIRRTYKRLALEAHPDKNPERREWAEARIRELIAAYEVLADPDRRHALDRFLATGVRRGPRDGGPFFFHRKTPGARALLILHHLVGQRPQVAAELLEEMEEEFGLDYLGDYLERGDCLDCLFLLAEHHVREKNYLAAAERLRMFYHQDNQSRSPRHYFDQVVDLLKDIYLRKLPKTLAPELQVTYLTQAAEFRLGGKDEVLRLRLLVETAASSGNATTALAALERLRALAPTTPELADLEALVESSVDADAPRRRRRMRGRASRSGPTVNG